MTSDEYEYEAIINENGWNFWLHAEYIFVCWKMGIASGKNLNNIMHFAHLLT